jgi:hypothetical protein
MGALREKPGGRGSFTADPKGFVEKALETGNFLHRGPAGNLEVGLIYQGLRETEEEGSRSGASLSLSLSLSPRETRINASFTGDPKGYAKAL